LKYEAWIHIAWNAKTSEYAVLWLDNTAVFTFAADGIGRAKPDVVTRSWVVRRVMRGLSSPGLRHFECGVAAERVVNHMSARFRRSER